MDPNWRKRATCAGTASRFFDPWDVPDAMWTAPEDVRTVCERCPVRVECLVDALEHDDECVRGGTTKRQRDAMKRPRQRSRCPGCESKSLTRLHGQPYELCAHCGLTWRIPKRSSGRQRQPA